MPGFQLCPRFGCKYPQGAKGRGTAAPCSPPVPPWHLPGVWAALLSAALGSCSGPLRSRCGAVSLEQTQQLLHRVQPGQAPAAGSFVAFAVLLPGRAPRSESIPPHNGGSTRAHGRGKSCRGCEFTLSPTQVERSHADKEGRIRGCAISGPSPPPRAFQWVEFGNINTSFSYLFIYSSPFYS